MEKTDKIQLLKATRFYVILDTGYVKEQDLLTTLEECIDAGARVIQFRAKDYTEEKIHSYSKKISQVCKAKNVLFILNDYADIAQQVEADGLHIGQDDGSLKEARQNVGTEMLIGRSTHTVEQAKLAEQEGFDYIGFGPLFPTPTKKGRAGIGLKNIENVENSVGKKIPVFCIGGVSLAKLDTIKKAKAKRVVIVSDFLLSKNKKSYFQSTHNELLSP